MSKEHFNVTVELKGENRRVKVPLGSDYYRLLRELNLNPEEVLIFADNEAVPFDTFIQSSSVRVIKVVSGG